MAAAARRPALSTASSCTRTVGLDNAVLIAAGEIPAVARCDCCTLVASAWRTKAINVCARQHDDDRVTTLDDGGVGLAVVDQRARTLLVGYRSEPYRRPELTRRRAQGVLENSKGVPARRPPPCSAPRSYSGTRAGSLPRTSRRRRLQMRSRSCGAGTTRAASRPATSAISCTPVMPRPPFPLPRATNADGRCSRLVPTGRPGYLRTPAPGETHDGRDRLRTGDRGVGCAFGRSLVDEHLRPRRRGQ